MTQFTRSTIRKNNYEKLNLEKLKTEMEILTTRREHFREKLDSIDDDFNKWLQEKELRKEFKNNILSEWHKNVENVNKRFEEVWKNNIKGKRNGFKKDKEELQKRSHAISQSSSSTQKTQDQNHRNRSSYHPSNNERYDQFNNIQSKNFKRYHHQTYKKRFYRQKSLTDHRTHYQDRNCRC